MSSVAIPDGVLLVDKAEGMTSHDVVALARRQLGIKKVGHCGTLDPIATGLLLLTIGRGTKVQDLLMSEDKEYVGTLTLGTATSTQDREGEVVETKPVPKLSEAEIRAAFEKFRGDFYQLPPMVSAKKHGGVPLYKLARQGKVVEREPRFVHVYRYTIDRIGLPEIDFSVLCSKGFYVRTYAHDIGHLLGCGAHLKVLRPQAAPHLLTATQHKIALIRALGVEHLLIIRFDKQFAATEPEDFVQKLVAHSKPLREICVGHEWSFGKNRRGNLALLKNLGAKFNFDVVGIPPVKVNDAVVSSTAIRQAIESGDLAKAAEMLGHEYTILGTVTRGDNLGKKIGFPTANLSAHSEQFPPNGVYAAEARIDGDLHRGVINLGVRPTVSDGKSERVLEIHLFDFNRDIYGHDVEVRFLKFLRPEKKFENLDALVQQIRQDVQQAREV